MDYVVRKTNDEIVRLATSKGLPPLAAKILAGRIDTETDINGFIDIFKYKPPLDIYMEDSGIVDGIKTLDFILSRKLRIVICTDWDLDGVSSAAVLIRYFKTVHKLDVGYFIGNRSTGARGVNEILTKRILESHEEKPIGLVITADHGSSDGFSFNVLKDRGISTICTDHHLVPDLDEILISTKAFINPHREGSKLTKGLSGCAVAYYLVLLYEYSKHGTTSINELETIVAMSTIGDQMPLDIPVNRYLFDRGTDLLLNNVDISYNAYDGNNDVLSVPTGEYYSRGICPIFNAAQRVGDPIDALKYLLAKNPTEAKSRLNVLKELNSKRKILQKEITATVEIDAMDYSTNHEKTLVVTVPKNNDGVVGILAGDLGDKHGRSCFVFSDHGEVLKGSGRANVDGVFISKVIDAMRDNAPEYFIGGGGHEKAGGCVIRREGYFTFCKLFEDTVTKQLSSFGASAKTYDLGIILPLQYLSMDLVNIVEGLEPYGQSFPYPIFKTQGRIDKIISFGSSGVYGITLTNNETSIECIMFNNGDSLLSLRGMELSFYIKVKRNFFRGKVKVGVEIVDYETVK